MNGVFYLDSESLHALSRITRRRPMTDAEAVKVALVRMLADIEREDSARGGSAPASAFPA